MIPIEDAAGGTAAGVHHEAEGTEDKDADEIADIEANGDHEQSRSADQLLIIEESDPFPPMSPHHRRKTLYAALVVESR